MQMNGYRIIPVNPEIREALGENAYATLLDVPEKIDIVNIFRRPEFVEEVVDQAIRLGSRHLDAGRSDQRKSRGQSAPGRNFRDHG
jgi:predicted CoA-binding protein